MFESEPNSNSPICILGLDVGDKRVGVAIAHSEIGVPTPLAAFERGGGEAERNIISLVKERGVGLIVVGLPLGEENELNEQCRKIEKFCRRLRNRIPVRIGYVDEYASSVEASERLSRSPSSNMRKSLGKGAVDAMSAVIIIESYLSSRRCLELGIELE